MKTRPILAVTKCLLAVILVLAFLLLGHGYRAEWPVPSPWQTDQMRSKVHYDPELTDPFFKSNEWSYPYGGQFVVDGMWPEGKDLPRLKHTAKCISNSFGAEHRMRFCKARLLDVNTIDLLIHDSTPSFSDKLYVQIRNGIFRCQYSTWYKAVTIYNNAVTQGDLIWTTKKQELTLDKRVYRKGDTIKGRIVFECVEEATHPKWIEEYGRNPKTIKVYGVFKTIVQ
ncbi:MAG: hypothetical protein HY913_14505 [Desulfomonile tiedjei]|nr:hypothetical protein [Desulfomonile tiedjei]